MQKKEMNDLDNAIKWFKTVKRNNDMACILPNLPMMKNIIKWLEKLKEYESRQKDEWIPVSERLPEPDKYIAISLDNCDIPAIGRYTVDDEEGGTFRVGNQDESFLEIGLFVNAWMPLPERYEEDKIMNVTIKFVKGGGVE